MIRLHKIAPKGRAGVVRGESVDVASADEALKHFTHREHDYVFVRCDFDEECINMELVLTDKNTRAVEGARLAARDNVGTCVQWTNVGNFADGSGWRSIWVPRTVQFQVHAPNGVPSISGR